MKLSTHCSPPLSAVFVDLSVSGLEPIRAGARTIKPYGRSDPKIIYTSRKKYWTKLAKSPKLVIFLLVWSLGVRRKVIMREIDKFWGLRRGRWASQTPAASPGMRAASQRWWGWSVWPHLAHVCDVRGPAVSWRDHRNYTGPCLSRSSLIISLPALQTASQKLHNKLYWQCGYL